MGVKHQVGLSINLSEGAFGDGTYSTFICCHQSLHAHNNAALGLGLDLDTTTRKDLIFKCWCVG